MKIKTVETEDYFSFDFEAETMEDARFLVQFALTRSTEIRPADCAASQGVILDQIVIGKRKDSTVWVRLK